MKIKPFFYLIYLIQLLLVMVLLTACITASDAAPAPATDNQTTYNISAGPVAPDWELPTLDGSTFKLADHQGDVVVMFFMASWCGSCLPEAQALAELHESYAEKGLTIVAINAEPDQKVKELERFRQRANNGQFAWAFDHEFAVVQAYKVQALDTTLIIDRSGRIAYSDASPTPKEFLEKEILKWL